jgi:hypothetical protein
MNGTPGGLDPSKPHASIEALEPTMKRAVEALEELAKAVADSGLPSEAVRLAEAVSSARSHLYQELITQGWLPPHEVPAGISLDAALLVQGIGSQYDGPSL